MTLIFTIHGLDCANCAAKLERKLKKLDGVQDAVVNFLTEKIRIECEAEGDLPARVQALAAKVELEAVVTRS